jgi:glutaconate CoA-transferase subunit B
VSERSERTNGHSSFSIDEWFVVLLARTIRDREVVFHGFGSPCAQVVMHVARHTHARDMLLVEGATYAVNPDPPFIPPTGNDLSLERGASYRMRFKEFFDAALRGDVDRMFLSGGQIDPYGNTNVTAIGPLERPEEQRADAELATRRRSATGTKVKLGGGGGGCNLAATIRNLRLWTTRHRSGRTLVESCDFVTDMGHRTREGTRAELGFTGGGPEWLVTELGVFDYDVDGRARLRQLFPDVGLDEVEAKTGFELRVAADLRPVTPPSPAEIAALRAVDPLGVRRSEFAPDVLRRTFSHGSRAFCAC